jgi:hypothetical protein
MNTALRKIGGIGRRGRNWAKLDRKAEVMMMRGMVMIVTVLLAGGFASLGAKAHPLRRIQLAATLTWTSSSKTGRAV